MRPSLSTSRWLFIVMIGASGIHANARAATAGPEGTTRSDAPAAPSSDVDIDKLMQMDFEQLLNLDVFSVSRRTEKLREAPQVITVITPEEMRRLGLRTIHDALDLVPGFSIQRQHRTERIWTRGLRESVLVLFDGAAVYDVTDNQMHLDEAFQLENIKQIEVIGGPGGVLWGHNAFLGIINIITKDPSRSPLASLNATYGSFADTEVGLSASHTMGDLGVFVSGHFTRKEMNEIALEYFTDPGINEPSRYLDLFGKLTYKGWTLEYRWDDHEQNSPTLDSRRYLMTGESVIERDPVNLAMLRYDTSLSDSMEFHGRLSWMHRLFYLFMPGDPLDPTADDEEYNDFKHDKIALDLQFNNFLTPTTTVVWGVNGEGARSYHTRYLIYPPDGSAPSDTLGQAEAKTLLASVYGQLTQKLGKQFTLGGGLRVEYSDERYLNEDDGDFEKIDVPLQFLFNLNGVYRINDTNTLKLIVARGLRRPSTEQSSGRVPGFEGSFDIKEESVYSSELDYTLNLSKNLLFRANYSFNYIQDLIDFRPDPGGRYVASNLDQASIHSIESEIRASFRDGSFGYINFNYLDGKTSEDEDFSIVNTDRINANLAYSQRLWKTLYASTVVRYVGTKKDYHQENDGQAPVDILELKEVPAYITWDLGVVWDDVLTKGLSATAFVYNVLNEKYYHQIRLPRTGYLEEQPGTTFAIRLAYAYE